MSQPTGQTEIETVVEPVVEFVPLLNFENDFEILNQYPFTIRKKSNHRVVSEYIESNGYFRLRLNQNKYLKHVLVAKQFITNDDPEHKTQVDHINHDRSDYHLSNLRWVSPTENQQNKSSHLSIKYEFVDDIPDEAMIIDFYETKTERREFEENKYYYYFDESNNEDKFYAKITDNIYKILHINTNKSGNEFVSLRDVENKTVGVYINRFKHQHDLI